MVGDRAGIRVCTTKYISYKMYSVHSTRSHAQQYTISEPAHTPYETHGLLFVREGTLPTKSFGGTKEEEEETAKLKKRKSTCMHCEQEKKGEELEGERNRHRHGLKECVY